MEIRQNKAIIVLYISDLETPEAPFLAQEEKRLKNACSSYELEVLQSYIYRAGDFRTRNESYHQAKEIGCELRPGRTPCFENREKKLANSVKMLVE